MIIVIHLPKILEVGWLRILKKLLFLKKISEFYQNDTWIIKTASATTYPHFAQTLQNCFTRSRMEKKEKNIQIIFARFPPIRLQLKLEQNDFLLHTVFILQQIYVQFVYIYILMFCFLSFDTLQELLFVCP